VKCEVTPCFKHEDWYGRTLQEKITALERQNAELVEKVKELEELKNIFFTHGKLELGQRVKELEAEKNEIQKEFDAYRYYISNTPFGHWMDMAEHAEAENAALRKRLEELESEEPYDGPYESPAC